MKYLIIIISFCWTVCSCGQSTKNIPENGFKIDSNIKVSVDKMISDSEFGAGQNVMLVYNNIMTVDFYENDELSVSLKEDDNKSSVFKSFYYWKGDTLGIDGAFGLFGGIGFSIKFIDGKATLYHMLASDDFPSYAYNEADSLIFRLEVPCLETKVILSEIPNSNENQIIYGYVEFKSDVYFVSNGSADGREILPRNKQRANMKIYFKSSLIEL
tara:strand:+ start:64 stop:705 length:642 start_codon:yes stop_codon:yes gene_type:complete